MSDPVKIQMIVSGAAVLVAVVSAFFAYLAHKTSKQTHILFNSRMTELMELAKKAAKAEGVLEEKEFQQKNKQ